MVFNFAISLKSTQTKSFNLLKKMKKIILITLLLSTYTIFSQSVRSININAYKYIVIDEINSETPGATRRYVVKALKKAGYTVVNLSQPLQTYTDYPKDLVSNKKLGLYLSINTQFQSCFNVAIGLFNHKNQLLLEKSAVSCGLLSSAIKASLSSLTSFNYRYDENLVIEEVEEEIVQPNEANVKDWAESGTGFFISKQGYIATNYHVIKGKSEFKISITKRGEVKEYDAKVIKVDKQNDLAILKIISSNFIPLDTLRYNLNTTTQDVASYVFALGYPLTKIMGNEIKFTDGKISSKSGFQGDITTYQISVPIQPGNSGGPLFDNKGNLVGVTSSGINKQLADNANYAIKTSYLQLLINSIDQKIELPECNDLENLALTEQIKILSEYVVSIKVR